MKKVNHIETLGGPGAARIAPIAASTSDLI
jgi:hypothetical protein